MTGATRRFETARGHWYKLDGDKVDGVTTIIGDGLPKPALIAWAAREVATFAADNIDTIAALDREARIDLLKGSHYRERDKAARRGTEVHRLAEKIIANEEVDVPDELVGHVDAYIRFLDDWQPVDELVEKVVGHRTHRWMGTLDMVATLNDGRRWLTDIKTTRSGVFGEVALQLAAYRNAEFMLDGTLEQPMPQVDCCGVIWVRGDGYDLIPVETGPDIYRTFRYAHEIARFLKRAPDLIGDILTPGVHA